MYTVVLLAAMSTSGGAPAGHKGHAPHFHDAWPGYHNSGGWGLPYGGYNWPGYACWGGCGGYASAAYGFPMSPLINPPPPRPYDPDEDEDRDKDKKGNGKKKPSMDRDDDGDEEKDNKKGKPKKPSRDDQDELSSAKVTFLLPAGAKLYVDGREVKATGTRTFVTPPLEKGADYYYEVKAQVVRDGMPLVETRQVAVKAGASIRADFRNLGERGVASKK